jgi:hypothetical protein
MQNLALSEATCLDFAGEGCILRPTHPSPEKSMG